MSKNHKKIIGVTFLHRHTATEAMLHLDENHVIVDKEDWREVIGYFNRMPKRLQELEKGDSSIFFDENPKL